MRIALIVSIVLHLLFMMFCGHDLRATTHSEVMDVEIVPANEMPAPVEEPKANTDFVSSKPQEHDAKPEKQSSGPTAERPTPEQSWFRLAAEQGDPRAQFLLGFLYAAGPNFYFPYMNSGLVRGHKVPHPYRRPQRSGQTNRLATALRRPKGEPPPPHFATLRHICVARRISHPPARALEARTMAKVITQAGQILTTINFHIWVGLIIKQI